MIRQHHNNPAQRHLRVSKTVKLLSQNYYFLGIRKKVEYYISKCQNCQLNKYTIYAPYRYIKYTKIIDYLWQNITINFIIKLPKSKDISIGVKYNSILMIMNKFIKYIHLISYNEKFTAKQTIYIVLDRIIRYYGISENIISDRDKIFKSNF